MYATIREENVRKLTEKHTYVGLAENFWSKASKVSERVFESKIRRRNLGCMSGISEEIVENWNENVKTDVYTLRVQYGITNADLRKCFGAEYIGLIGDIIRGSRLRWFGHVERKTVENLVKRILSFDEKGKRNTM